MFQRTYNWEEDQWERLWEDLLEIYVMDEPRNHFIGAIVTQSIPDAPARAAKHMLIDGQQRMTTLLVLLGAIKHRAEIEPEAWPRLADEIQEECLTNKFASHPDERLKFIPTQRDQAPFETAMNGDAPPVTTQIGRAWEYFDKALGKEDAFGNEVDLKRIKSCIVNYLDMVSIVLEQDDSPNRIFESLNNTGMVLRVSDLIRNYLFMNIPDVKQQESAYQSYWYPMQQLFSSSSGDMLSDFFWRYQMMDGSLPRYDDTFDGVRNELKNPTPQQTLEALGEFSKFSRYYAKLAELGPSDSPDTFTQQIHRLNQWEVEVAYPFLMRALDRVTSGDVTQEQLVQVMRMIESFVVRRTVCGVPTNRLRRVFAQMSAHVDFKDFVASSHMFLADNEWPSDDEFRSEFVGFRLYLRSRLERTRLVLRTLEQSFGHNEVPEFTDKITIEHIMPQTLSDDWKRDIGANALAVHVQWLDTIGNLTMSGYNPNLSNLPFSEKKVILADSKFDLSASLQDFDEWNDVTIQQRGTELAERAVSIWAR